MRVSIASPLMQPSPNGRRVGIRIVTFEACSGFTHVTARRIAQPPKATFVTRLQPNRLPDRAARQLPDQSTTLWVESSSTSDPRLRGALPSNDFGGQEPGGTTEIMQTAHAQYGVSFPLAAKAEVRGPATHPFYKWAALERPGDTPRWNFHKYLVGRDGHIAAVFATQTEPTDPRVIAAIERELAAQ